MSRDLVKSDSQVREAPLASRFPDVDWHTATVKVSVDVDQTTGVKRQEIEVPVALLLGLAEPGKAVPMPTGHSWPTCRVCGKPHDSNGCGCPAWTPPAGVESTPHRADCPTCERRQFVWTDGLVYFCGYCGCDLGPCSTVALS